MRAIPRALWRANWVASKVLEFADPLKQGGSLRAVMELVKRASATHGEVLLVGHEPCLSRLITTLTAGNEEGSIHLKKGGLCKLRVPARETNTFATMEWLLTPKQMKLMVKKN